MKDEFVVIPKATISRLPLYFRVLSELDHVGVPIVSSEEMAAKIGITSSQLRKDLSYFGGLGIRGTGYDVSYLLAKIKEILGMNHPSPPGDYWRRKTRNSPGRLWRGSSSTIWK